MISQYKLMYACMIVAAQRYRTGGVVTGKSSVPQGKLTPTHIFKKDKL